MSKLRQTFQRYENLPENILWICDRLDKLQGIQQMLNTPWEGMAVQYWMDMQKEYTERFGGDILEDLVQFVREYM